MQDAVAAFLRHLEDERNASAHTLRAYAEDLQQFTDYLRRELGKDPRPEDVDHLLIRGFLADLHRRGLKKTSSARKLAALRSFFRHLCREGRLEASPARLLLTPPAREADSLGPRREAGRAAARAARRGLRGGARTRDPRAALRDRDALRGARGARRRGAGPRLAPRARAGQGPQGAHRALRLARAAGAPPVAGAAGHRRSRRPRPCS